MAMLNKTVYRVRYGYSHGVCNLKTVQRLDSNQYAWVPESRSFWAPILKESGIYSPLITLALTLVGIGWYMISHLS